MRLSPRPWGRLLETPVSQPLQRGERPRVLPFVALTSVVALLALVGIHAVDPQWWRSPLLNVLLLIAAATAAELLGFEHGGSTTGSVALIPFTAAMLIAPDARSAFAIALSSVVVQVVRRRPVIKGVFNTAQLSLSTTIALLAFRLAGGKSFDLIQGSGVGEVVAHEVMPAIVMMACMMLANTALVSYVVSIVSERRWSEVWSSNARNAGRFFALTCAFAFYLAWLFEAVGPLALIGLSLPLLAVRQLYRTTVQLTSVTEELLDLFVAAIEARDPYTSGHSKRVSEASRIIAGAIGLKPHEVERVSIAALLHDVGKIHVSFAAILGKEGKLTPEEWVVMKAHPGHGAQLVGLVSSLRDLVLPVRHHHENWDGSGYPDGLSGERIPLASRIIIFADTLDAMLTNRPYRRALSMQVVRSEFIKCRGRQFDPTICDRVLGHDTWVKLGALYGADVTEPTIPSAPSAKAS